jgi:hypothetical protein
MSRYLLVWEDTRTARIRREESASSAPIAWFRVTWVAAAGNEIYEHAVERVDVYAHAPAVRDRAWLRQLAEIRDAVAFCDQLLDVDLEGGEPAPDWSLHSVEVTPAKRP